MSATKPRTMNDVFSAVESLLQPLRAKQAAEVDTSTPTATTIKDQEGINEAEKAGSNVASVAPNSDGLPAATSDVPGGVPASSADSAPTQLPAQEIPAEQKVARFHKLANCLISITEAEVARETAAQQAWVQKEAAANLDPAVMALQKRADEILQGQREIVLKALVARANDEFIMKEACASDPEIAKAIEEMGGIDACLNKIAEEMPEAVLSSIDPSLVPPSDAAPEALGAEGAPADEDIDELAAMLDAQGVTPDDIEQANEAVQALKAEGKTDEEIIGAIQELMAEAPAEGGDASAEAPAEGGDASAEAPAEGGDAPAEAAPAESTEEKEASVRKESLKDSLKQALKI